MFAGLFPNKVLDNHRKTQVHDHFTKLIVQAMLEAQPTTPSKEKRYLSFVQYLLGIYPCLSTIAISCADIVEKSRQKQVKGGDLCSIQAPTSSKYNRNKEKELQKQCSNNSHNQIKQRACDKDKESRFSSSIKKTN